MQFGTIYGNAYRCEQVAFMYLCHHPGGVLEFLKQLDKARTIRIRNFIILMGVNSCYIESLDSLSNDGLSYYAGAGIDIVAIPLQ